MRADRLLSEILMLQSGKKIRGREMAERLEVSERTVHRDMESLSAAGVPLFALRGARGGWQLEEGWRMQVPRLDESELRALLMAQPRLIGNTGVAAAAERAMSKLVAALPGPLHEQAASIRQRLCVDATAWRASTENLSMLPIVQEAVSRDRKLEIRYRKSGHEATTALPAARQRVVDPLGLVAKGTSWYLVAQTPAGFRTFRVSRIEQARILPQPCVRPTSFDLAEYWKSSTDKFQKEWIRYEAVLSLEPSAAELMRMWRVTTPIANPGRGSKGWVTFRVQFDQEDEACFVVQGLGPSVDVVEPKSLGERVAKNAVEVLRRIAGNAGAPPQAWPRRRRAGPASS